MLSAANLTALDEARLRFIARGPHHPGPGGSGGALPLGRRRPLPCWWSRVVRGWASCCGHDVLPLSLDDPGGVVTRSSRALVTADKGNGPQCVRSFAGVGAGPVVHWLTPYRLDREAAGEMDIEDIDVFIGIGRR